MKILIISLLFPALLFARVGPDLSKGADISYFTELRMNYAKDPKTSFFPIWQMDPENEAIIKAYREGHLDKVIDLSDAWLKKCPVDADTHLRVAMCFKEKGDIAAYNYHLGVFYGLLSSITSTGDGLSPETAFHVISTQEEYSLIQEIGGRVLKQTLVAGPSDRMEISRRNGEVELTLYFNVSIPMKFMESQMKSNQMEQ